MINSSLCLSCCISGACRAADMQPEKEKFVIMLIGAPKEHDDFEADAKVSIDYSTLIRL
jgi:hypothetical protein